MAKPAVSELLVVSVSEETERISLRNKLVKLIERDPGRTIHGVVLRIPEDSKVMELVSQYDIPVARGFSVQPPKHNDPDRFQEPTYFIREENVASIQEISPEDLPVRTVFWGDNCE